MKIFGKKFTMGAPGGLPEFSRKFVFGTCYYKYSLKWCWVERAVHYRFSKKKLVETAIWSPCLTAGWTAPWSPCISTPFRNRETKCHHMALTKTWIEEFFFQHPKILRNQKFLKYVQHCEVRGIISSGKEIHPDF